MGVNDKTGLYNLEPRDPQWVEKLFGDYDPSQPYSFALLTAWQEFIEQYAIDPRDITKGFVFDGTSTTDLNKVLVNSDDGLAGFLGDKLKTDAESGILINETGTTNRILKLLLNMQQTSPAETSYSLLNSPTTLKKLVAGDNMTIEEQPDYLKLDVDLDRWEIDYNEKISEGAHIVVAEFEFDTAQIRADYTPESGSARRLFYSGEISCRNVFNWGGSELGSSSFTFTGEVEVGTDGYILITAYNNPQLFTNNKMTTSPFTWHVENPQPGLTDNNIKLQLCMDDSYISGVDDEEGSTPFTLEKLNSDFDIQFTKGTGQNSTLTTFNKIEVSYVSVQYDKANDRYVFGKDVLINGDANGNTEMLNINKMTFTEDKIKIGEGAVSTGDDSISIGSYSSANTLSASVGYSAFADGNGTAIGADSRSDLLGIAIGFGAKANEYRASAIGFQAKSYKTNSYAYGLGVQIGSNSDLLLALGSGVDTPTNTTDDFNVLFGIKDNGDVDTKGHKITNGAEGTDPTDFATVSQIDTPKYLYNNTGAIIKEGTPLHLIGKFTYLGVDYPTFQIAKADKHETCQGTIVFAKEDIAIDSLGKYTFDSPKLNWDTSGLTAGLPLYLSATTAGEYTSTKPEFPNFAIQLGGAYDSTTDGQIFVNQTTDTYNIFDRGWDGSIVETFNFYVDSDGTTVTGTLTNADDATRDLTLILDDNYTFDTTTAPATITLTPGTDEAPQQNFVYIPADTKVLTVSTSGFPETLHCKIATLEVQSALNIQSVGGARKNQNTNNHLKKEGDNGAINHIREWIRLQYATWGRVGCEATLDSTGGNGYLSITGGQVYQLHKQITQALTMPTNKVLIKNDPATAYRETDNLNTITQFSDGSSWNNSWGKIVVWLIANKTNEPDFLCVNIPSSGYNFEENALKDELQYADYTIPNEYKSNAILVGAFAVRLSFGTLTYNGASTGYQNLRGTLPITTAGSSGGGGVTTFLALTDVSPTTYLGNANKLLKVNNSETGVEFSDVTIDDSGFITTTGGASFGGDITMNTKQIVGANNVKSNIDMEINHYSNLAQGMILRQNGASGDSPRLFFIDYTQTNDNGNAWSRSNGKMTMRVNARPSVTSGVEVFTIDDSGFMTTTGGASFGGDITTNNHDIEMGTGDLRCGDITATSAKIDDANVLTLDYLNGYSKTGSNIYYTATSTVSSINFNSSYTITTANFTDLPAGIGATGRIETKVSGQTRNDRIQTLYDYKSDTAPMWIRSIIGNVVKTWRQI